MFYSIKTLLDIFLHVWNRGMFTTLHRERSNNNKSQNISMNNW